MNKFKLCFYKVNKKYNIEVNIYGIIFHSKKQNRIYEYMLLSFYYVFLVLKYTYKLFYFDKVITF